MYDNAFTSSFLFTVPDGWAAVNDGWQIGKGSGSLELGLASSAVRDIYADACTGNEAGGVTEVGPRVRDLVTALLEQPSSIAEGPFEATIGGYPAQRVDISSPPAEELQGCALVDGIQIWHGAEGYYVVGEGENSVYVVDVDGNRVVLPVHIQPDASEADRAELDAIIESIVFADIQNAGQIWPGRLASGWLSTSTNPAALYSWTGAGGNSTHLEGFMHNGYGSGDVAIQIGVADGAIPDADATAVEVAGHNGFYRRLDPQGDEPAILTPYEPIEGQGEEWIVDIEGTTLAILLTARPGTSQADLDDAHSIIDSMWTEPIDHSFGFRLVFRVPTDDWDSG